MDARLSAAVFVAAIGLLTSAGADAACSPSLSRGCVDFTIVPEVTKQIVGNETTTQSGAPPAFAEPQSQPYTGPTVGLNSMTRRAPEVGYRWSLE